MIMKFRTLFITICVLTIVAIAFSQHLGRLFIRPSSDASEVFVVQDEDGNPIVSVNTSTDGATINGTAAISSNTTVGGTFTQTGIATFSNVLDLSATLVCAAGAFTSTETTDTVLIAGALGTDKYLITPGLAKGGTLDGDDTQIAYSARADTLIVIRPASGLTALTYSWLRIR